MALEPRESAIRIKVMLRLNNIIMMLQFLSKDGNSFIFLLFQSILLHFTFCGLLRYWWFWYGKMIVRWLYDKKIERNKQTRKFPIKSVLMTGIHLNRNLFYLLLPSMECDGVTIPTTPLMTTPRIQCFVRRSGGEELRTAHARPYSFLVPCPASVVAPVVAAQSSLALGTGLENLYQNVRPRT